MKVLQVTVHFSPNIGGVETHLDDLVAGLAHKGNTVFVLTYRPLMTNAPWKIIERRKKITIVRLPWIPGFFYQLVENPIIEFLYLTPGLFFALPFVLARYKPDVIHAHGLVAGFISVFWGKIFHKNVVVSTHSLYHFPSKGLYLAFSQWIFNNAHAVLCLSKQSVNEILKLGVSKDKVKQFVYWIDLTHFRPMEKKITEKFLAWEDKFVVLFVGRLVAVKGIRELLQATQQLSNRFLVVIIGDGPLREEVKQVESENKNKGKLVLLDRIDNRNLPEYYSCADVTIVPSTHDEGFGRVILESLACGTPVIGSKRGAIPDAMDETVGKLISVSPDTIAQSIKEMEKNKGKTALFRRNTRSFAQKRYSEKNIEVILSAYTNN